MGQTLAIFQDAFRRLRAQRMFWIALMLSGLVVASFACIGINDKGLSVLSWQLESDEINTKTTTPEDFYKGALFGGMGVNIWLAYAAVLLAIISTASIVPDMVSAGSISMMLSKPISRVRAFLTVYASGLLFVALQVAVFCAGSFLVLGVRGGFWDGRIFLAVPIVVCVFSYLYCVCALVGVVTRSTLTALLLTLLFWASLFVIHVTDVQLIAMRSSKEDDLRRVEKWIADNQPQLTKMQRDIKAVETQPAIKGDRGVLESLRQSKARLSKQLAEATKQCEAIRQSIATTKEVHAFFLRTKAFLPKVEETSQLTQRYVLGIESDMLEAFRRHQKRTPVKGKTDPWRDPSRTKQMFREANAATVELHLRGPMWALGTSLAFELVVLAAAAIIFQRRDF